MVDSQVKTPVPVRVLAVILFIFGVFALVMGLTIYGMGFLFRPPEGAELGYPVADTLVNGPSAILAAVGLWRMRKWGYAAVWFVVGFYIYASVEIFATYIQQGPPYLPEIFVPQTLAVLLAITLMVYSWRYREQFA